VRETSTATDSLKRGGNEVHVSNNGMEGYES